MIVVDACVAVKWFLPEEGSEQAMQLLAGQDALIAPDLIRVEVAAAITRRVRTGGISEQDAKETLRLWCQSLKEGILQTHSKIEDIEEGGRLSLQLKHPLYDCVYLAVARRTASRFVTADRRFFEKALSVHPAAEMLYQ